MNALALLAELDAAGIHVTRDGDNLRVRGELGVNLVVFTKRIRQQKPALVTELLKIEILAVLDVEPAAFDRAEYDRLWAIWLAYEVEKNDA